MLNTNDNPHTNKPFEQASLKWDEQGRLVSEQFGDIYFDQADGLAESRYVFLDGNDLPNRWTNIQPAQPFVIAETGFGTGLNFLATWKAWQENDCAGRLIYHGIEKFPIDREALKEILSHWPELQSVSDEFLTQYHLTNKSTYDLNWPEQKVTLHLYIGDVNELSTNLQIRADAWYLDGFAPTQNPDMWTESLFKNIARCTKTDGTLATFSAAGPVKTALRETGFFIKRRRGFGKKWHMIQGWKL